MKPSVKALIPSAGGGRCTTRASSASRRRSNSAALRPTPSPRSRIFEEVARMDTSAGWTVFVGCGTLAMITGWLPDEGVEAFMVDGRLPRVACGVAPTCEAVPVKGGYELTGRWQFASGSKHAEWFAGHARVKDGTPPVQNFIFPIESATRHDNWTVNALKGTGSGDVSVDKLFVPAEHSFNNFGPAARRRPAVPNPDSWLVRERAWRLRHRRRSASVGRDDRTRQDQGSGIREPRRRRRARQVPVGPRSRRHGAKGRPGGSDCLKSGGLGLRCRRRCEWFRNSDRDAMCGDLRGRDRRPGLSDHVQLRGRQVSVRRKRDRALPPRCPRVSPARDDQRRRV